MSHRSPSSSRAARRVALVLAAAGLSCLASGPGCSDKISSYGAPMNGPPNGTSTVPNGGTGGTGGGPATPDLCACAEALHAQSCLDCVEQAIAPPSGPCLTLEDACANSPTCTTDAQCVGACLGDGGLSELDCIGGCLKKAGTTYLGYLRCTCTHCSATCTTPGVTCP